ncbi:hypothetical protein D3C84_1009760 [compost metagenome]
MATGLGADIGEGAELRTVLLHVRQPGTPEIAQRQRHAFDLQQRVGFRFEAIEGRWTITENRTQGAGAHLLEADRERTVHGTRCHRLACQEERGRTGRAVVVDVDHRHTRHSDFVHCSLPGA